MTEEGQRDWAECLLVFLNSLHPRHEDAERHKLFLGLAAGIPAPMPGARAVAPEELREKAIREFHSTLRGLVDRWIDSGKQDGGEQPLTRSVKYGAPEPIEITLLGYWRRHPPLVLFDGEKQSILTQGPPRQSDWVHLAKQAECELLAQSRDYAIGLFASLIDSPSRFRIFKCAACHVYFTRARMPKKGSVIRGGSYCDRERCRNAASKRRVRNGRGERLARMIGCAADAALTWKDERRSGSMADWVVKRVRKEQPCQERRIAVNWYTRHKGEIDCEVERRKHAKG